MDNAQGWVLIVVAVGTAVASVISAWKAASAKADTIRIGEKQVTNHEDVLTVKSSIDTVKGQQDLIAKQVQAVDSNTDGRATRQDAFIDTLSKQVVELTSQIAQQNQHIAVLVSDKAQPSPVPVIKP